MSRPPARRACCEMEKRCGYYYRPSARDTDAGPRRGHPLTGARYYGGWFHPRAATSIARLFARPSRAAMSKGARVFTGSPATGITAEAAAGGGYAEGAVLADR